MIRHARKVSETTKKVVAAAQEWRCAACGELLTAFYEVDHRVGLWRGGTNEPDNLQALHRECHAAKGYRERRAPVPVSQLFDRDPGGAYPLELAQHLSEMTLNASLDTRDVQTAHMEVYPPHWREEFTRLGARQRAGGRVLQGVRLRETTRATH